MSEQLPKYETRSSANGPPVRMSSWPMTESEPVHQHVPYTGTPHRPNYYRPTRRNPRIDPSADVSDVLHAWAIDSHPIGEAIAKLLRAGKKPGESMAKDLTKVMEHVHRAIEFAEMEAAE